MGFTCPCGEFPSDHDHERAKDCLASLVCFVEERGLHEEVQEYFEFGGQMRTDVEAEHAD